MTLCGVVVSIAEVTHGGSKDAFYLGDCVSFCVWICFGKCSGDSGWGSTGGRTALTGLTIYNQDFAVIRTPVELNLQAGTTDVSETNVTAQVEPDSVVLRDVTGKRPIRIHGDLYLVNVIGRQQIAGC
jgi:hypothetical protein